MVSKVKFLLVFLLSIQGFLAQQKDDLLLIVDGDSIRTSEFLRVYNKNLDLVKDESQKNIDSYLKLFKEYQLKLKEAKRLKLDEDPKYQREFLNYKKQLTKNYLSENKVTDALIKEAYDRNSYDVNASHVLVRLDETVKDTAQAYNKISALRARVLKEGFDKLRSDVHDGTTIFVEDLGYFSAFKMVYDFETAAYNTPVGEISQPFRTQFGYHVVKVNDKRPSRGTVTAAHIMIALDQKDSLLIPEERINEIYKKLNQGENFEALAKQFSDDKSSAKNGGKLSPFKSGQLSSTIFEDEAFGLANDGEVSKPFKTKYGWHIVKRISLEPIKSFDDLKPSLEAKVKRDSRSKLINEAMVDELKGRYNITYNKDAKSYFEKLINDDFFSRSWRLPESFNKDEVLFTINEKDYLYDQFGSHLMAAQRAYANRKLAVTEIVEKEYNAFFEAVILKYREANLELENEEFANILKEYRDGLLLFDLMEKEIWNKASKDTLGLESFYEQNKLKYKWNRRLDFTMASSADENIAKKALKLFKRGKSQGEIEASLNTKEKQNIIFTSGIYDADDNRLPANLELIEGVSGVHRHNQAFHVVKINNILLPGTKTLKEAKGMVINDYQSQIESNWIQSLYERFTIEVNEEVLQRIKAQINN
ncbi:peptidylprolyl isomerase [Winogradskyella alexanderae]|uniref:Peptidylprolyl isomerase n=1 Tax=Winogradskyella alexanderae TaxID=2877123 RepID=A0ABS7XTL6_9FLAO|nr:peptidylprolyl isomerase [Winogradskyella alexanderae]MCA0132351.1 peptidylprolyl isomerase [Winogradskyella alexanderae]